ncbi:MAG TPA: ATP-binding protein [Acidimicrobiales bacterium]|nr:ATP-binding protein [Acidimicrobiales bacterium]
MSDHDTGHRPLVTLPEAAEYLHLPVEAVQALVGARFLEPVGGVGDPADTLFPLVDLKAFLARNADYGAGNLVLADAEAADPQALLDALDGRAEEMARRAFDIFSTVFTEAQGWSLRRQARFIEQAKGRFEAILAVTSQGAEVDEALVGDLQEVGAAAAWDGSPLPQLLVVLRISRDLVVQTAVGLAEERGRHWGLALSLLLTRVLPAIDRLTDALAEGYWAAMVDRQQEARDRYEHVIEHSSDGIFEVDLEGRLRYANPSLAMILGLPEDDLTGTELSEVMTALDGGGPLSGVLPGGGAGGVGTDVGEVEDWGPVRLTLSRADGVRRVVEVRSIARRRHGELVGHQGVVRDVTSAHDLEAGKNEFLALVTNDLRSPLSTIVGLGATLEAEAGELSPERVRRAAASIRSEAERISRLADDLSDVSRLEATTLLLSPRPTDLSTVVAKAVARTGHPVGEAGGVEVRVPGGVPVVADPVRLEQVLANIVDNAFQHGEPPVVVEMLDVDKGMLELVVTDQGGGVPPHLVPTLFSRLRTLSRADRDPSRGTGLGLSLARGIIEAMGGQVWYQAGAEGGARFHLTLPVPRRRHGD